jgi:hypothetical protein
MLPRPAMNASELPAAVGARTGGVRAVPPAWAPVRRARAPFLLLLLSASAIASACAGPRQWRDLGERAVPFEQVWTAVVETSSRHGFAIDHSGSDRGRGIYQSRWRTWAQGFGQTHRLRIHAEMEQGEVVDSRRSWRLRFHVERQTVPDMARSMDPREADWEADGQERDLEDVIEAQLRLRFGDKLGSLARPAEPR